ncbi:carboxypeptidase regulatory-like domain-containing protein [Candidatus Saccharibacteria bacterium]|nr:MAG: carboxypeptidase regulatory-like domain-containing protein [Candidatus Saccharibacteria bacterium]
MKRKRVGQSGFTLVELSVSLFVMSLVIVAFFGLFISLVRSTIIAKRRAVAITLATNQMEYLKSLPYDSLAVVGGSILAPTLLPATKTETLNGVRYTTTTGINYADDAYDGCGSYPNIATKQKYCRNYPPPSGAPALDTNPADYKTVNVVVVDRTGTRLAVVDTQISARVAETASNTGAIFVTVTDPSGTPVSGATVTLTNSTTSPIVNLGDTTDAGGTSIFYGMPPDSAADYVVTATKSGYSSITTIGSSGSLQPVYPKLSVIAQQSSYVTLAIAKMGTSNSLILETTDTSGAALPNVRVYMKGGYKKYTLVTDTAYYYDSLTPADTRPLTGADGMVGVQNLVPINGYTFCGDAGATSCVVGSTTYYLAAAVPYGGENPLRPITIPQYDVTNPPSPMFDYGGVSYTQKVRLMLTTNSAFPRVSSVEPGSISMSGGGQANLTVTIKGVNLTGASITFTQGSTTYSGSACSGSSTQRSCEYDFSSLAVGAPVQMTVTNAAGSLLLPTTPLGGLSVTP